MLIGDGMQTTVTSRGDGTAIRDTRTSQMELSLSPAEVSLLKVAAESCIAAGVAEDPEEFVARAQRSTRFLPADLMGCLTAFRRFGSPTGGLLIRGCPVFDVPPTPEAATLCVGSTLAAAGVLGIITAVLGDQYGFKPELAGRIVQDILPVPGFENTQQSISSESYLYKHMEMAFTDDRADYVALFCVRADHDKVAGTTLSPIEAMLPRLSDTTVNILREPRFKTTVDGSFLLGMKRTEPIYVGPICVLSGSMTRPRIRADFAETTGLDTAAQSALDELRRVSDEVAIEVRLEPGDLLFVDNHHAFHGRTPFRARRDGADRWLLRTFVSRDLSRSEAHRPGNGRIVDTDYSVGENVFLIPVD
jgi:L-asparagine oxygenase